MSIKNVYEIDAAQAVAAMQSVKGAFEGFNSSLGTIIAQSTRYNKVGAVSTQTLTSVDSAGRRTIATVKEVGGAYNILSTKTSQANASQIKQLELFKSQEKAATDLAKAVQGPVKSGRDPLTGRFSSTIPDPKGTPIGIPVAAYSNLTEAQLRAAAAAKKLSAAQTDSLILIGPNAAKAKQGFDTLASGVDNVRNKLEQVGKVAFATLIYRSISLIQQGLSEGAHSAIDYGHQIGLIQTISQDSGESFDSWNQAIRGVADELGRPATEVAKAAYDALSNQVIKSTKDFDLLRTSITLEQNTGSSAGTGLNTISALLNGLGASSLEAETLADKLFVTIDKGRVRLEELDKVLGRTISLQQQAGASFDETSGALAVLTQSGINSAEATTLLNNVYSELIKPNEALGKATRDLGFDSAEAAVQALTLAGYLKQIGDIAKKTPAGLATFFPDIRGLRGASTLFTQTDNFVKSIESIQNSQGANKAAKGILDENDAQRILKEAARIKNYFTVDLGVGIVQTVARISDSFGGFSKILSAITPVAIGVGSAIASFLIIGTVSNFVTAIGQLAIGFRAVAAAIGLSNAAAVVFGTTLTQVQISFGVGFAAATAVFLAGTYALNKLAESQNNATKDRIKPINTNRDDTNDFNKESASKRVEAFNKATDSMTSTYQRTLSGLRKLNDAFAEDSKKKFDEISEAIGNSFNIALTYIRKNVNELEQAEEKSLDNLKKLSKSATDVREDAANRQRDYQVDAIKETFDAQKQYAEDYNKQVAASGNTNFIQPNAQGAIEAFGQIAQAQINQARKSRDQFLSVGDLKNAEKEYDRINAALDKYKSNLESVGANKSQVLGIISKQDAGYAQEQYNKILAAKKQIETQNSKEYDQALEQRQLAEKLNDVYKDQVKFGSQVFDKKGNLTDDYAKEPAKALKDFDALNEKRRNLQDQLQAPKNPIEASRLTGALAQADQEAAAQRNALANRLAASTNDASLAAGSQARIALATAEKKAYAELTQTILDNNKKLTDGAASIQKIVGEVSQTLKNPGQTTFNFGNDILGGLSQTLQGGALGGDAQNKAQQLLSDIKNLTNETNLDVPKIKAKLAELNQVTTPIQGHTLVDPDEITSTITIQQAIQRMTNSLSSLKETKSDLGDAAVQMLQFKNAVQNIDTKSLSTTIETLIELQSTTADLGSSANGIDNLSKAMNNSAAAARNEAAALRELNAARGGGGGSGGGEGEGGSPEGFAGGGSVGSQGGFLSDFYSGKFAKGSDTIPVMMTRDEFVVRAPMARKFYSQLIAMNNNQFPIYRSEGGSVSGGGTNTSHNYNIHVAGGTGTSSDTAKTVVGAIRRAQRQGTIK